MSNPVYLCVSSVKKLTELTISLLIILPIHSMSQNHTVRFIRAKCFQEYGGWHKIESLISISSIGYAVNEDNDTTYFKATKNKFRQDTNIIQTKQEKYVFFGDSANRFVLTKRFGDKPVRIGGNLTKESFVSNSSFSIHPFLDVSKQDKEFTTAKDTIINGSPCFYITYTVKDYTSNIFIQQNDFHIVADCLVSHSDDRIKITTFYSNFKRISGILFPFTISSNTTNKYSGSPKTIIQEVSFKFTK